MTNLLRLADVCKILSVGKSTVYELINSGDLKHIKIKGATRFAPGDIDDLVARLREQANDNAGRAA